MTLEQTCSVTNIHGMRCRLDVGHESIGMPHDFPLQNISAWLGESIATITASRDQAIAGQLAAMAESDVARAERNELRALLYGEAETIAPELDASERKASAWWYAAWKVGNRRLAELTVAAVRHRARIAELEAELAKERERTAGMLGATPLASIAMTSTEARLAWQGLGSWSSDHNDAPHDEIDELRTRLDAFALEAKP